MKNRHHWTRNWFSAGEIQHLTPMSQDIYMMFNAAFSTAFLLLQSIFLPYEIGSKVVLVSFCPLTPHRVPMPQQKLLEDTYQHERREDRKHFSSSSWWKFWDLWFFFSLQNSQRSRLLQECSLQPGLRWKSVVFNCSLMHSVQQQALLTSARITS